MSDTHGRCQAAYRVAPAGLPSLLLLPECPMRMCGEPGSYIHVLGAVLCAKHQEENRVVDSSTRVWRYLPCW